MTNLKDVHVVHDLIIEAVDVAEDEGRVNEAEDRGRGTDNGSGGDQTRGYHCGRICFSVCVDPFILNGGEETCKDSHLY